LSHKKPDSFLPVARKAGMTLRGSAATKIVGSQTKSPRAIGRGDFPQDRWVGIDQLYFKTIAVNG